MTEQEWPVQGEGGELLKLVRQTASVRKLRLVAAAFAKWLQGFEEYQGAKHCADLIEEVADHPKPGGELKERLDGMWGDWSLSHTLGPPDRVGNHVSSLVWFATDRLTGTVAPNDVHGRMRELLLEIFGNPFRPIIVAPHWLTENVVGLAGTIYDERCFDRMPILADALMDAGCFDEEILNHCRGKGPHVRGCWVVDMLLGKG